MSTYTSQFATHSHESDPRSAIAMSLSSPPLILPQHQPSLKFIHSPQYAHQMFVNQNHLNYLWNHAKPSKNSLTAAFSPSLSRFFAVTLHRSSFQDSWGLSICMLGGHVILGDACRKRLKQHTVRVVDSQFVHPCLVPGDAIFAINGRCAASYATLKDVTSDLRQLTTLELLIFRHGPAVDQARAVFVRCKEQRKQPMQAISSASVSLNPAYNAAQAAFVELKKLQDQSAPAPTVAANAAAKTMRIGSNDTIPTSLVSLPHEAVQNQNKEILPTPSALRAPQSEKQKPQLLPLSSPVHFVNPSFQDEHGKYLLYDDNWEYNPDDGFRAHLFLPPINNFSTWLRQRKAQWRKKYQVRTSVPAPIQKEFCLINDTHVSGQLDDRVSETDYNVANSNPMILFRPRYPFLYRNALFKDNNGLCLPYEDNWDLDPDDNFCSPSFITVISDFKVWLKQRKAQWRGLHHVAKKPVRDLVRDDSSYCSNDRLIQLDANHDDRFSCAVPVEFWIDRYDSFSEWLCASKCVWKPSYSWNCRKRKRLQSDCHESVSLDNDCFEKWLRVRKNQWKIERRKRQRLQQHKHNHEDAKEELVVEDEENAHLQKGNKGILHISLDDDSSCKVKRNPASASPTCVVRRFGSAPCVSPTRVQQNEEIVLIDSILEEQERRHRLLVARRQTFNMSSFFDASLGCPDDVIATIFRYLDPLELGKLLCISKPLREALIQRKNVWQQLCPTNWKIPRRPRKPWHELYFFHLRREKEDFRKRCDDLLSKVSSILWKGDHLQSIEKLVSEAERKYSFDVNYSSGVTCERNSILNLAVIFRRHKVVRWLVETKAADIETCDRGFFTPLMNSSWAGDKSLVRFFLQKGADRSKLGKCHYTKPLASFDFKGLTAEGWAEQKGYSEIATLLRLGL